MTGIRNRVRDMHRILAAFLLLVFVAASNAVWAQEQDTAPHDKDWVQDKIEVCASCHGKRGVSEDTEFPIIAGQYESYLYQQLKAYRDGGREDPVMASQVGDMTDAQLKALAGYFARQDTPLYTPEFNR